MDKEKLHTLIELYADMTKVDHEYKCHDALVLRMNSIMLANKALEGIALSDVDQAELNKALALIV
ncbi:MAG: hypothetical protein ACR2PH_17915 [Desulfobulbia bacterium]